MKILLFVLLLSAQMVPLWAQRNDLKWLQGTWTGMGYQLDSNGIWEIKLSVQGKDFRIEYPTLHCIGDWKLTETDVHIAQFKEIILQGTGNCISNVSVYVTKVNKEYISISYFLSETLIAFSTLQKLKE